MVQLAGHDVDTIVQAALMLYEHTDGKLTGIDLNCGCPQTIAKKGNYGAHLMEGDPDRVYEILKALRNHLPQEVCVSTKIRLPMADDNADNANAMLTNEWIPNLLDTGIHFLTIHGRSIKETHTKLGDCHTERIRLAVNAAHKLDPTFPIVANGGMETYNDVQSILQSTGASAAMSSEALLETPDLFLKKKKNRHQQQQESSSSSSSSSYTPQQRFQRQLSFANQYLDMCEQVGPPLNFNKAASFNIVRGHLFTFLHRYINKDAFNRDLRNELCVTTDRTLRGARNIVDELESRYTKLSTTTTTTVDDDDGDGDGERQQQWNELPSSAPSSSWYRRHRPRTRRTSPVDYDDDTQNSRTVAVPLRGESSASASAAVTTTTTTTNAEDRKREIKERIAKLKEQRKKRKR